MMLYMAASYLNIIFVSTCIIFETQWWFIITLDAVEGAGPLDFLVLIHIFLREQTVNNR